MRDAGRTSFLEVVSYTEEECMRGADDCSGLWSSIICSELWDDDSVAHYIKEHNLKYCPLAGKVSGSSEYLGRNIGRDASAGKQILLIKEFLVQTFLDTAI